MKYIVTGGAGFIGSAIVWYLNKLGINEIIIVDKLGKTEKWQNLKNLKFEDYIDKDEFINLIEKNIFSKIDTIFHLGACSSTTEKDADYLIYNNYKYTQKLCEWALKKEIFFIYASSAATYGDGNFGFSDREEIIPKLRPLNMYAYSKQLFDLWALRNNLFDKITGLKYFNVFGPNEYHKEDMRSVVVKSYEQIKLTGKVKLFKSHKREYKDGWQLRDFIYIKDAVKMTIFLFENRICGIFNIGTGKARSFYDLVKNIFEALNLPINIEYIDMPKDIREKYQYFTQADMKKLKSKGYKKKLYSLEEGIKDYVLNYLETSNKYLGKEDEKV